MGRHHRHRNKKGIQTTPMGSAEDIMRDKLGMGCEDTEWQNYSAATRAPGAYAAPSWAKPESRVLAGRPNPSGVIRFSPKAWSKFQWFRDRGNTEISGFGVSKREEPLYIIDFVTILQKCSTASIELDDDALGKYMQDMVSAGYHPTEILRIWLHTHPGESSSPSGTDYNTFRDVFGSADWAMMIILAKGGSCYARVRFSAGPGGELELKTMVDLIPPFDGVTAEDYAKWEVEYQENIRTQHYMSSPASPHYLGGSPHQFGWWKENEGTSGFSGKDKPSHPIVQRMDTRFARSLASQQAIPDWGGSYRYKSSELAYQWKTVSETVEQIWQIDENKDGTTTVITDTSWYTFAIRAKINAVVGDELDSLKDISDELPRSQGEVAWRTEDNDFVPLKITRLVGNSHFIDLRKDANMAKIELGVAETEKQEAQTGGFAASTPAAVPSAAANASPNPQSAPVAEASARAQANRETDVLTVGDVQNKQKGANANSSSGEPGFATANAGADAGAIIESIGP